MKVPVSIILASLLVSGAILADGYLNRFQATCDNMRNNLTSKAMSVWVDDGMSSTPAGKSFLAFYGLYPEDCRWDTPVPGLPW